MPAWLTIALGVLGGVAALAGIGWTLRDRLARARLDLALEPVGRERDEEGRVIVGGTAMSRVNYALHLRNDGRKAAGRTEVAVWAPRTIEVRWAADGNGGDLTGAQRPSPSDVRLADEAGGEHPAVELRRSLDSVPLIGETLYLRFSSGVPFGGSFDAPVKVRVRSDGAPDTVEAHDVLRWAHRAL